MQNIIFTLCMLGKFHVFVVVCCSRSADFFHSRFQMFCNDKKSPQAMKELSSPLCPGYINGYFAFLSNFVSTDEQNLKFVLL